MENKKEIIIEKWDEIMENLKAEFGINTVSYETWLTPLQCVDVEDDTAILLFVDKDGIDSNNASYIMARYSKFIRCAIGNVTGLIVNISIVDKMSYSKKSEPSPVHIVNPVNQNLGLKTDYTFENFVVSKNNSFAHATALKVAEAPGEYYNPLYIYGDPGLGKTHLMHSIAHFIIENSPSLKIMYVTSEQFMNELIEAIKLGNIAPANFREKYRNIDVLLIDDIQFIIGKESTQEEFFHTFNALYEKKKQIVISSDKPPKDFNNLEERLRSRFDWGLIVDLTTPDYETKMAILKKKLDIKNQEGENIHIGDDILSYVAEKVNSNIRTLEGALNKIIALSKIQHTAPTLELAEYALRDIVFPNQRKVLTPEFIIEVVAEHYSMPVSELLSKKRDQNISIPRQIAMYISSKYTDPSLATTVKLGKIFNRDHSTIIHGIDKIAEKVNSDSEIANQVKIIVKKLNIDED